MNFECKLCEGGCEATGMVRGIHEMASGRFVSLEDLEEEGDSR